MTEHQRLFLGVVLLLATTTVTSRGRAMQAPAQVLPGDIFVVDFEAGTNGSGALFFINRTSGARTLVSDFGNAAQGPTGQSPFGLTIADVNDLLVVDSQGVGGNGVLFRVNPATGGRTILSDFGNAAQGPTGVEPVGVVQIARDTLVVDLDAGTNEQGALFKVDPATGVRTLLSDFGNAAHGPVGREPTGIARGTYGALLIVDPDAGTDERGALFQVDRSTGFRTMVSDFGNAGQGPIGSNPGGVALGGDGVILVVDTEGGTGGGGLLFTVDPLTGARAVRSIFGNPAQGATGVDPFFLAVAANGSVLVTDDDGGTDLPLDGVVGGNGALFAVNPTNGTRTVLSDFGNVNQGPTGVNPVGVAIVPLSQPNDIFVISPFTGPSGVGELVRVNPVTGNRAVVSDFSNGMQGPTGGDPVDVALGPGGDILVVDEQAPGGFGGLFVVNPRNGARTLLSNFAQMAQGPRASQVQGVALGSDGAILVVAGSGGTANRGALFRVDPRTGIRTVVSDFGDPTQGPLGSNAQAVVPGPAGDILVIDPDAISPSSGTAFGVLFRVDPASGARSLVSDFGNANQGPVGFDPIDLVVRPDGHILVSDLGGSPTISSSGVLFSVNPATGARTRLSDFGNTAQGVGRLPYGVALETDGDVLVVDSAGGTGAVGALFLVNPVSGVRTVVSDFGSAGQGPTGARPQGLALLGESGAPGSNTAPTISDISNQITGEDTPTGAIPFMVNDADTPPANLTVSATSSNPTVVPAANVVLGGAAGNRTVTIAPASGQLGSSLIRITVSDGSQTASDTFTVTVTDRPFITISFPKNFVWTSSFLRLFGFASDRLVVQTAPRDLYRAADQPVTRVTWATDRGASGTAEGTTEWVADIPLFAGVNVITVTATDSGGATATDTVTVTVNNLLYFLAEGATGPFFDLDILLGNPNAVPAPVTVTYLKEDGSTHVQTLTLPATSRTTIAVEALPGLDNAAVSAVVDSTSALPILVERSMTWDAGRYGAHTGSAVDGARMRWLFGEGSQGFFDTFVLLANANAVPAAVTLRFLTEGAGTVVVNRTVTASSRLNVWAGQIPQLVGTSFSIVVESDVPIIAERAMYFPSAAQPDPAGRRLFEGGHESPGVGEPARTWFHAEGATGPFFDTFILVGNPNATPASVTFTYLLSTGQTVVKTVSVAPDSRLTVNVESEHPLLAQAEVSVTVASDVPVISERAMYWPGTFTQWAEAHNSFGVTALATKWGLAEGRVGNPPGTPAGVTPDYQTFILLANPNATAEDVRVTYLRADGTTVVKTYTVPATSRFNVWVNAVVPELAHEGFSTVIESLGGQPIAVERAMYNSSDGVAFAAGTNATAVRTP